MHRRAVIGVALIRVAELVALVAAMSCLLNFACYGSRGYLGLRAGRLCAILMPPRPGRASCEVALRPSSSGDSTLVSWDWDWWSVAGSRGRVSGCALPLWPVVAITAVPGAFLLIHRKPPGRCRTCSYDISTLPRHTERCPECGAPLRAEQRARGETPAVTAPPDSEPCPAAG